MHMPWHELLKILRSEYQNSDASIPGRLALEESYQNAVSELETEDKQFMRSLGDRNDNPLGALSEYLDAGVYPPPELLMVIDNLFQNYMSAGGTDSLEHFMFGGIKNYSGKRRKTSLLGILNLEIILGQSKGESQEEIVAQYIKKNDLSVDPDTLLRNYRRTYKGYLKR